MNDKFDEVSFLKATISNGLSAAKSGETVREEFQKAADKKSLEEYAQAKNEIDKQHNDKLCELNHKKDEVHVRFEKNEDQLNSIEEQLNSSEVLNPSFQYLAPVIKTILETGRADSIKEALNLAISDEKDEKERLANREHERIMEEIARQEEARAADADLSNFKEQLSERQRNEQQEYERRMEKEQERERQEKEDEELKRATFFHCAECTKYAGCPIARTKNGLNCTGFQQKEKFKF
jgi:hypothetical protein